MYRQRLLDVYGGTPFFDINIFDDWSFLYTSQALFWQGLYARFYAKEMFDIAMALDKENIISENAWFIADKAEAFAKLLEDSLVNKPT